MYTTVVLSVGSNCSREKVSDALSWLSEILDDFHSSELYRTPSIHGDGVPYVNAVVVGHTGLTEDELNLRLKKYEVDNGRDDACRQAGIVPVDIDIVIWDSKILRLRDFRHDFFQIGYRQLSEFSCPVI